MSRHYYAAVYGRYGRAFWEGGAPIVDVVIEFNSKKERDEFCEKNGPSYPHERGWIEPIEAQEVKKYDLPVVDYEFYKEIMKEKESGEIPYWTTWDEILSTWWR